MYMEGDTPQRGTKGKQGGELADGLEEESLCSLIGNKQVGLLFVSVRASPLASDHAVCCQ